MPAQGKTNASRVQVGDRILVRRVGESGTSVEPSQTKTGAGVMVARVTGKTFVPAGPRQARGTYVIQTTAGNTYGLNAIQTMWLAPEDPAGIKRAHVEALKEDQDRTHAEKVRAQLRTATTEALADALTDASPSLAALIQAELDFRRQAELELELAEEDVDRALELKVPTPELTHQEAVAEMARAQEEGLVEPATYVDLGVTAGPGTMKVAPIGTPAPTPEDLADLALALAAEDLEHLEPEEVRVPKPRDLRCVAGDVVTIHNGTRLYEVLRVEEDAARNNVTGELADMTMARVAPCDPEDHRDPQWVHVDLLHVRTPVARLRTVESRYDRRVRYAEGVVTLPDGSTRRPALMLTDPQRQPTAHLMKADPEWGDRMVATLRAGESLVLDGRCFRVLDHGQGLVLEPARWRDRLPVS